MPLLERGNRLRKKARFRKRQTVNDERQTDLGRATPGEGEQVVLCFLFFLRLFAGLTEVRCTLLHRELGHGTGSESLPMLPVLPTPSPEVSVQLPERQGRTVHE